MVFQLLNRNPPFGNTIISAVKSFPQFKIEIDEQFIALSDGKIPVTATLNVELSLMNENNLLRLVSVIGDCFKGCCL